MNRQIRLLGAGIMVLFLILFLQLNDLQVLRADSLDSNPDNSASIVKEYTHTRGYILSADGTILAQSKPSGDAFKYVRSYPTGPLYEEVTGFYSFTYGSDGAEKSYDSILTGKQAIFKLPTDISGLKNLFTNTDSSQTVMLTLRDKVQQAAQAGLANRLGSVVALDPKNGAVLAMYSNPTFDPNLLSTHNGAQAAQNYQTITKTAGALDPPAYRQTWFPGSSFKVITSAAVYDHRADLVGYNEPTTSALNLPLTKTQLHNFAGENCGGPLPQLFTVSCDTGFGDLGLKLGPQNLLDEATAFGFNAAPPIDLPYGVASKFPSVAYFDRNQPLLAYSAIGQDNVQSTPLEMALVAAGIADNGVIMTPHILDHVSNSLSQTVRTYSASPWKTATSPQTAASVTQLMETVVNSPDGTGTAAAIPGVTVAGKTGTAQTGTGLTDDWFIAFAPAQNPQIAVAVVLPDQGGANDYQGGTIAAPVAKAVIQACLALKAACA